MRLKQHLLWITGAIVVCASTAVLIFSGYRYSWTGFINKALWDWMQLLVIPVVLAAAAILFNLAMSRNEQKIAQQHDQTEHELTLDNQREAALQVYIDKMSELLLHEKLRDSAEADEVRYIARARTLTVLSQLDLVRKGNLLLFLYESGLINTKIGTSIIDLSGADLSGANLSGANLSRANLSRTNLSGADLSAADLSGANLSEAKLTEADLMLTDLSKANLNRTKLNEASLCNANLSKADLTEADLSYADLGVTQLYLTELREGEFNKTKENSINKLVMIVDDSVTVRKIIETALRREGIQYISYSTGLDALNALVENRLRRIPDLIILDIHLPKMDGYEFARRLKAKPQFNTTIIVILTQLDSLIDRLQGRLVGAKEYITKPFRTQDIMSVVHTYLGGPTKIMEAVGGADLSEANFSNANLNFANLFRANLSRANLSGADLTETNLEQASSLKDTRISRLSSLTPGQLEACKAKGAVIDDGSTTVSLSLSSQSNDAQTLSAQGTLEN